MILFILIFAFVPSQIQNATLQNQLIVWNVGQGSWSTIVQNDACDHFDTGGEHAPVLHLRERCGAKLNRLHYSHWDWDHVSFTTLVKREAKKICLAEEPAGHGPKQRKKLMDGLSACDRVNEIRELRFSDSLRVASPGRRRKPASSNEASRVFITDTEIFPGDSVAKAERLWVQKLSSPRLRLLILGHHGSRTSTSEDLLRHLPHLKQAVASARYKRYGHPHRDVLKRLRAHGIAVLRTEDWGSLHFERSR